MKKPIGESIANLENQLLDAKRDGNKRKSNCIEMILKRLKKEKPQKRLIKTISS
jgi:hypothetical protein